MIMLWVIKKQYYKFPCLDSQFQNVIHTKIISSIFVYLFLNLLYLDKSYTHQIVLFISFYLCERVRVRFDCFGSIVLDYPSRRFSLQAFYISLMAKNFLNLTFLRTDTKRMTSMKNNRKKSLDMCVRIYIHDIFSITFNNMEYCCKINCQLSPLDYFLTELSKILCSSFWRYVMHPLSCIHNRLWYE